MSSAFEAVEAKEYLKIKKLQAEQVSSIFPAKKKNRTAGWPIIPQKRVPVRSCEGKIHPQIRSKARQKPKKINTLDS